MATEYPTLFDLADDAAAGALNNTTHQRTGLKHLAASIDENTSPSYEHQYNANNDQLYDAVATSRELMCVKIASSGLNVGVFPGFYDMSGKQFFEGDASYTLTDDSTNYLYINSSNVLAHSTSSWPADDSTYHPIAIITTISGNVSGKPSDRRGYVTNRVPSANSATGTENQAFQIDSTDPDGPKLYHDGDGNLEARNEDLTTYVNLTAEELIANGDSVVFGNGNGSGSGASLTLDGTTVYVTDESKDTSTTLSLVAEELTINSTDIVLDDDGTGTRLSADGSGGLEIRNSADSANAPIAACSDLNFTGTFKYNGSSIMGRFVPACTMSAATEVGQMIEVTIQVKQLDGSTDNSNTWLLDIWLADSNGGGETSTVPNSGTSWTTGTVLETITSDKRWKIITDSTGTAVVEITHTGVKTYWVMMSAANFVSSDSIGFA